MMKRSNKRIALILAGTLMLGGTGAALAFGGYGGHGGCDRSGTPMRALGGLENLSDEQRDQLKEIFREQRDTMRDKMDAMRDNRRDLRDAMQDGADKEKLRELAQKQGEQVTEMILLRAQMRDKVNAVLTEEQRDELKNMPMKRYGDDDDDDYRRGYRHW